MTIFGLDSAGKTAGIAILRDSRLIYECYLATGHTHSETLLCLCKNAFDAAGLSPAEIDVFAAAAGPGSFTGLRIGLAAVKGLAFPHDTPCAAVSTLEALDAGRFYATQGPRIHQITLENDTVTVECSPVSCAVFNSHLVWSDDRCKTGDGMTKIVYPRSRYGEDFVRVHLIDAQGRQAWSNVIHF